MTVKVSVASAAPTAGVAFAALTVQPAGTLSAAVPAGIVPEPDFMCSVAVNGVPGAL